MIFQNPNLDFSAHSQCFVRIFAKSTLANKLRKRLDFGSALGGRNDETLRKHIIAKYYFFEYRFSFVLKCILASWGRFGEALEFPKIAKNDKKASKKPPKKRVQSDSFPI